MTTVLNQQLAEAGADAGMTVAASHADRTYSGWSDDAVEFFALFARRSGDNPFMTEEVRAWAEKLGFPPPPDSRAWGHVAKRAAISGAVRKIGYDKQRSATCHGSPKTLWVSVREGEA